MEWIGPFLVGILILGGLFQLFWAYAIGAIAQKTDQSEFMQVLAWIPLLQLAPTLAAGGGSLSRFLVGALALIVGNGALLGMAAFLGDSFGRGVAALGLALTGLIGIFYFGRIACNTATARDRPGWMGILLFVPILNLFIYPYFAFHDGWVGPNKIGLAIGLVFVAGGMAPSFQVVQSMNESGSFSPALLVNMTNSQLHELIGERGQPPGIAVKMADPSPNDVQLDSSRPRSQGLQKDGESIRVLYALKSRFDTLEDLARSENLSIQEGRERALAIIQTIRADLNTNRARLDDSTYGELASHLLGIETRIHSRSLATTGEAQYAPAAFDPAAQKSKAPSFSAATAPPVRPYPVHASNDCPAGTETRTKKNEANEEEWCQQSAASGGLRQGWYARYDQDGQPESMGQYEQGLRVGVWTRFHPTGEVRAQAEFREGLQHGWALTFNRAGERTRSARFENGAPVLSR